MELRQNLSKSIYEIDDVTALRLLDFRGLLLDGHGEGEHPNSQHAYLTKELTEGGCCCCHIAWIELRAPPSELFLPTASQAPGP